MTAPISLPASRIIMVVEKFIKNIPNPNDNPSINNIKFDDSLPIP